MDSILPEDIADLFGPPKGTTARVLNKYKQKQEYYAILQAEILEQYQKPAEKTQENQLEEDLGIAASPKEANTAPNENQPEKVGDDLGGNGCVKTQENQLEGDQAASLAASQGK